jgi:glycosyltransferase involved in cell wall biosynthesis
MPWDWTERLADAWALVAPSLYREPLGLVAIEAIARDVPVIAGDDGGFSESIEDGSSGLLFPNGDGAALLDRMLTVAEGRAFADHLPDPAARARLTRRHDVGDHVQSMQRIWRESGA